MTMTNEQPTPTPAEATAQLSQLKADSTWRDAFLSGNGPQVAEFKRLSEIAAKDTSDDIGLALAGKEKMVGGLFRDHQHQQMVETAGALREAGIPDAAIRQALAGEPVSREEQEAAVRTKKLRMGDKAWSDRYLAGGAPERQEMTLLQIVLNSPLKEASA